MVSVSVDIFGVPFTCFGFQLVLSCWVLLFVCMIISVYLVFSWVV